LTPLNNLDFKELKLSQLKSLIKEKRGLTCDDSSILLSKVTYSTDVVPLDTFSSSTSLLEIPIVNGDFIIVSLSQLKAKKIQRKEKKETKEEKVETENTTLDLTVDIAVAVLLGTNKTYKKPAALEWIDGNATAFFESKNFLEFPSNLLSQILERDTFALRETEILEALIRWGENKQKEKEHEKKALKEVLGDLLFLVRFPLFNPTELAKVIKHNILNQEQYLELFTYTAQDGVAKGMQLPDGLKAFSAKPRLGKLTEFKFSAHSSGLVLTENDMVCSHPGSNNNEYVIGDKEWKTGVHEWRVRFDELSYRSGVDWDYFVVCGISPKVPTTTSVTKATDSQSELFGLMNPRYLVENGDRIDLTTTSGQQRPPPPEIRPGGIVHCKLDLGKLHFTLEIPKSNWKYTFTNLPSGRGWYPYWNVYGLADKITLLTK